MGWFDWLRSTPAPVMYHPRFGKVRASHRPREGEWLWEALAPVPSPAGPLDMTFDAGEQGPGEGHSRQLDAIIAGREDLTRAAMPLLSGDLADFLGRPLPADPWEELALEFVHLTGKAGEFEMAYSVKSWPDAHVAVFFEEGRPTIVQIDD